MKYIRLLFTVLMCSSLCGCVSLKAPIVQQSSSLDTYKYAYITPTSELTSSVNRVYGGKNGVYGGGITSSLDPKTLISGILLKHGYICLSELDPELLDETLIVTYGESGRRSFTWGYTLEATIQFLSAKTMMPVCVCTAEGCGHTEADDLRIAINRAMGAVFK